MAGLQSPELTINKPDLKKATIAPIKQGEGRLSFLRRIADKFRSRGKESDEQKPETFDVISQEQISEYKKRLMEEQNIDLSEVSVNVVRPGEELFDREEIKFKYFPHAQDPKFEQLGQLLQQSEEDPQSVSIEQLRTVAQKAGVALDARMPGFAAMTSEHEMFFFAVREDEVINMAQKYAKKEKDDIHFKSADEAKEYLRGLAGLAFLHEAGHVYFGRNRDALEPKWQGLVNRNPQLRDKVVELQSDKYEMEEDVPVAEEAFADWFVAIADPKFRSRIGVELLGVVFNEAGVSTKLSEIGVTKLKWSELTFDKQEKFRDLRKEAQRRAYEDVQRRIVENPKPSDEEDSIGMYFEELEPQCRDAIFAMRRKGWSTTDSGFDFADPSKQWVALRESLDSATIEELSVLGVEASNPKKGPWRGFIDFHLSEPNLESARYKWDQIAVLLPDLHKPAQPSTHLGADLFRKDPVGFSQKMAREAVETPR